LQQKWLGDKKARDGAVSAPSSLENSFVYKKDSVTNVNDLVENPSTSWLIVFHSWGLAFKTDMVREYAASKYQYVIEVKLIKLVIESSIMQLVADDSGRF
jgi:hypothetical protein